jgi:hypothetical protein
LKSDRGALTIFHHEYTEIQGLWNKLDRHAMYPVGVSNLIDDLHAKEVKSGDELLYRLIKNGQI